MKKTILFLVVLIFGLYNTAIAQDLDISSYVEITLTPQGEATPNDKVALIEGASFTSVTTDGDVTKMKMNHDEYATNVDIYAILSDAKYSMVATAIDDLNGRYIGVQASENYSNYVFTFNVKAMGRKMCLEDLQEDSLVLLTSTTVPYEFTMTANAKVENRFRICAFVEPTICHQYGNLIITGHKGAKVKVLDMADAVAIAEQTLATDDEVIDLSSLEKGAMYQVVLGEDTMIIRVQ